MNNKEYYADFASLAIASAACLLGGYHILDNQTLLNEPTVLESLWYYSKLGAGGVLYMMGLLYGFAAGIYPICAIFGSDNEEENKDEHLNSELEEIIKEDGIN